MKLEIRLPVTAVLVLLFAAGCGQKGPLFLPGDEAEDPIEIPSQESDESEDENDQPAADND